MYAKKHRPMQKLTAICLSVTIAAASLLSGHVFASDEAPQTDYLTGWELLAELREMGLGQDVIPDEEAPESDNSSETNTEDPSDTTGEPGDGDQTGGTEPGNPDEGGSGEGDTDPGESTPEQPGGGDQTGGTEPSNPDGNNPGEGGSGEGDTDTDTDPGTDNPGEQPDDSDPAAGTDPDQGDGAEQGSNQNQPSAPAESTEPAPETSVVEKVPLVTQDDEDTADVIDPDKPEIPESTEPASEPETPSQPESPSEPSSEPSSEPETPSQPESPSEPSSEPSSEPKTPSQPKGSSEPSSEPESSEEELPETSGITEEQRAALEAYVQTLEPEQIVSLEDTDITAAEYDDLYSMLTSGQISDLYDYLNPPVSMTDVPSIFELYESQLPSVRPFARPMKLNADTLTDSPGLNTTKTVTVDPNDPDRFQVTLEAYANGQETTVYTGLDIILVLDTSQNVNNKWMNTLKKSVNSFIANVVKESQPSNPHRIAAVGFGSDPYLVWGDNQAELLDANSGNLTIMQQNINNLYTHNDERCMLNTGVERAEDIVSRLAAAGQENRKTVVIIFASDLPKSDKEPEKGEIDERTWNFAHTTATKAVQSTNRMKQDNATIYTIGIYDGVDPTKLYGDGIYRENYGIGTKDVACAGHSSHVNATSGNNQYRSEWGNNIEYEKPLYRDIPTANRMMNLMSSNFDYSEIIGSEGLGVTYHSGEGSGRKIVTKEAGYWPWEQEEYYWASTIEITQEYRFKDDECNYPYTNVVYGKQDGFFAGTEDVDELESIFENLSHSVGGSAVELDENAVLKDVVTPYFDIVGDVSAYSVDETGLKQATFTPVVDGNTITVTDFDYEAHYVGKDSTDPQKLVVTFTIKRKAEFLGGNGVPTNGNESGVYANADDAASNTSVVENFSRPSVNVPIDYSFDVTDKTIYLSNSQAVDFGSGENGGVFYDGGKAAASLGGNAQANDYVNITYTVTTKNGTSVGTYEILAGESTGSWGGATPSRTPEDCEELVITCTVSPTYSEYSTLPDGIVAPPNGYYPTLENPTVTGTPGGDGDINADIHVLKPTFTFRDTKEDSGETVDLTKKNLESTEWSDFNDGHSAGTATGPVPTFVLTYDRMETGGNEPNDASFTVDSVANFKLAGVTINDFDVTLERDNHYKVIPDDKNSCDVGLGIGHTDGRDFTIHLNNFNLTIEKKLAEGTTADPNESFRIIVTNEDTGFTTSFMLKPGVENAVILTNLPAGTYTISEDTDWSWRYDCTSITGGGTEVNKNITTGTYTAEFNDDATVTYTNKKDTNTWLSWEDTKVNVFNPAS